MKVVSFSVDDYDAVVWLENDAVVDFTRA